MTAKYKDQKKGHRERVRTRFIKEGSLDSFQDYEILELLLFYACPRRDTKSLAKSLLEQYQSINNLFNASPKELMEHGGLTENMAVYLSMMSHVARRFFSSYYDKGVVFNNFRTACEFLKKLLGAKNYESIYLLSLDINKKLVGVDKLMDGSVDEVNIPVEPVLEKALLHKAKFVILAHNHPSGLCEPSDEDCIATKVFKSKFDNLGIKMLDHIIICGEKNYSFEKKKLYVAGYDA